jgi:hypothetical protein
MSKNDPKDWADPKLSDDDRRNFIGDILTLTAKDSDFRDRCLNGPRTALAAIKEAMADGSLPWSMTFPEDFLIEFNTLHEDAKNSSRLLLRIPDIGENVQNSNLSKYLHCTYSQWLKTDSVDLP